VYVYETCVHAGCVVVSLLWIGSISVFFYTASSFPPSYLTQASRHGDLSRRELSQHSVHGLADRSGRFLGHDVDNTMRSSVSLTLQVMPKLVRH